MGTLPQYALGWRMPDHSRSMQGAGELSRVFAQGTELLQALHESHLAGVAVGNIASLRATAEEGETVSGVRSLGEQAQYLAPELVHGGAPNVQSDLYAVGAYLRDQFEGAFTDAAAGELTVVVAELPAPLARFLDQATARDPSARFCSAREMLFEFHVARCELWSLTFRASALPHEPPSQEPATAPEPSVVVCRSVALAAPPSSAVASTGLVLRRSHVPLNDVVPARFGSTMALPSQGPQSSAGSSAGRFVVGFLLAATLAGLFVWKSEGVRSARQAEFLRQLAAEAFSPEVTPASEAQPTASPESEAQPTGAALNPQRSGAFSENAMAPAALPVRQAVAAPPVRQPVAAPAVLNERPRPVPETRRPPKARARPAVRGMIYSPHASPTAVTRPVSVAPSAVEADPEPVPFAAPAPSQDIKKAAGPAAVPENPY